MGERSGDNKPKPGLREWINQAYVEAFITAAVEMLIIGGIYFVLIGTDLNRNTGEMYGFIIMFIPVYTILVPIAVIHSTRRAYIRGKWEVKEGEDLSGAGQLRHPWLKIGPGALVLGAAMTFVVCMILWASGAESLNPVVTCLVAFGAVVITSSILIRLHLRADMTAFVAALTASKPSEPLPFGTYFLREYVIPWTVVITAINVAIGTKVFSEEAFKTGGGVRLEELLVDIFFVFLVIAVWMLFESGFQVRPDIHLGLVTAVDEKPLGIPLLLLIILAMSIVVCVLAGVPLAIAGVEDITVFQGTLAHLLTAATAGVVGMAVGLRWGRAREFPLLHGDAGD